MMQRTADAIESLALALWVGGLASFAFVFAPVAFHAIADRAVFGAMTARVLLELGLLGTICGIVTIAVELSPLRRAERRRAVAVRVTLVGVMLAGTAVETLLVVPQMAASIPQPGAATEDFDRQHHRSSVIYGLVLLCGLGTIAHRALATRPKDSPATERTIAGGTPL